MRPPRLKCSVGPTNENRGIRINSAEERIASGSFAHRDHAHHIGLRLSGEWTRSGGGVLSSKASWAGSTRGAEPLLTNRISARIEAS